MMYKVRLYQQPSYLLQHITQYQPIRSLRSSSSVELIIEHTRTIIATRAFCISAPTVWNRLPSEVKEASSQYHFLRRLKGTCFNASLDDHGYPAPLYHRRN
jgi:hypothetical protein